MDTLKTIGEWFITGLVTIGLVAAPAAPAAPVDSSAERVAILEARIAQLEGAQYDNEEPVLGAEVPNVPALFDSFLAVGISPSATTMTLAHSTTRDGETLSGRYCFTLEINTARAEYVCGNASGATVTGLERGIKVSNPNATSSALAFSHGRLATVSITDFPAWQIVKRQLTGQDVIETTVPLRYDGLATTSFSHEDDIVSRKYVDDIAFGEIPAASDTASGFVETATQTEAASSTSLGGTGARAVLGANLATSTYNSATAGLRVVVTQNNGTIDQGFMPATTTKSVEFRGITTMATTTVNGITLASTTQTTFDSSGTWGKPTSGTMAFIEVWGGGGSGGGNNTSAGGTSKVGGGGGGGYAWKIMRVADLGSTVSVTVGAGGSAVSNAGNNGNAGGDSSFGSHVVAYGGGGGGSGTQDYVGGGGGAGPMGVGGNGGSTDIGSIVNAQGTAGNPGVPLSGVGNGGIGMYGAGGGAAAGNGGSAYYGGAGGGGATEGGSDTTGGTSTFGGAGGAGDSLGSGTAGTAPGGGGGGSVNASGSGTSGAGASGRVRITVF